ncbi:gliding motility-associated ABC transporter substrate-binding protein GldG [Fulvivirgaceae bacterium BMA12]|uniref:Gliding motility-associated ABC transporter substrate-binding protein GldG n=1 Tax=Agaribacillus aureus TaxID=3051825 RepID=A0ABT8L2X5_9BACT|nr:gliding motility-associated ABC transporter substrate-binding protein GldG [Fulvivirgaceae bacterium BMA12]
MVMTKFGNSGKMWESLLKFGIGFMVIMLVNLLVSNYILRVDLTEEKRFTISEATKSMLRDLDDVIYIEVFLEGELPAGMRRLKTAIRERLDEFRVFSHQKIQFQFIDPSQAISDKARQEFHSNLANRGLQPIRLFDNEGGKNVAKIIFPGAIITYHEQEKPVMLLRGKGGQSAINQSIEGLEYELASAIRTLTSREKKKIGLIKGHRESDSLSLAGLTSVLAESYNVFNVNLPERNRLEGYDAVIIAKPKKAFSEADKFKLDQYIMSGGKALFFLDQLYVNEDSALSHGTFALPVDVNLDDQLFKYGVRVNRDLVLDLSSGVMPVIVNMIGDEPEIQNFKWHYYPIINQFGKHPIVKNSDAIYGKFINTVDTVKADGIVKTPLLFSSRYSKKVSAPARVALEDIVQLGQKDFEQREPFPVAYLLEGSFNSLYRNRFIPKGLGKQDLIEKSVPTKIMVVGDGDIIENEFSMKTRQPVELGFSEFMKQKFANEDFIKNSLQYMLDDHGLITARNKEIKIRPLNEVKVGEERLFWQVLNMGLPIVLIIIYGLIRYYWRKRRFTRF